MGLLTMFGFLFPKKKKARPKKAVAERRPTSEPVPMRLPEGGPAFLLRRDGFRSVRLKVRPDGSVLVCAPEHLPEDAVLDFVRSRREWLERHLDFFAEHRGEPQDLRDGGTAFYLGRPFRIRAVAAKRGRRARLCRGELELPCVPASAPEGASPEAVAKAFHAWRMATAKRVLPRRLARMEERARDILGDRAAVSEVSIRTLKRTRGLCTAKGRITLDARLVAMPLPLIDYVICHELSHLRRMDHSPAFHAVLRRLLPDAREREKAIRLWSLEHPQ